MPNFIAFDVEKFSKRPKQIRRGAWQANALQGDDIYGGTRRGEDVIILSFTTRLGETARPMFQDKGFQPDAAATYDLPEPQVSVRCDSRGGLTLTLKTSTPQDDSQPYDWNYSLYPILNQDNIHSGTHYDLGYDITFGIDPMATTTIGQYVRLYRVRIGQNTHVLLQGFGVPSETPLLGTSHPRPGMGISNGWSSNNLGYAMPEDFGIDRTQVPAEGPKDESTTMSMEWTPSQFKEKSRPGRHELEVPVETGPPELGLSHSYAMGSAPMESASGNPGQAWEEGGGSLSGSVEDHQDEAEMLAWLMVRVDGSWRCRGCGGRKFYDRSTLRRHCRKKHSSNPDVKVCPYCGKRYARQCGVNRHIKQKHGQSGVGEGSSIQ
jgi:hypothetical protein